MAENNNNTSGHLNAEDYGLTTPVAPEGGTPAYPGNNTGNGSNNDYGITLPVAPEGGIPAYPGNNTGNGSNNDYGITLPIAPEGGIPAYPGNNNTWTPPITTLPIFPSCPSCGITQNNAQVRFLNASTNTFPVNITIDNTTYATNARFGTISNYDPLSDGFHTITVRRASGLGSVLLQQTFPFSGGQRYTMVLVDTAAGGLNMVQVPNNGCNTMNYNTGCYRVANMSYSGSSYDVMLYSHDAVFRNVNFQEVTAYKQAMAGSYQFYITNANTFSIVRELPMIVIGTVTNNSFNNEPLVSYQVDITAGTKYTSYLIGNNWSDTGFRVLTVED